MFCFCLGRTWQSPRLFEFPWDGAVRIRHSSLQSGPRGPFASEPKLCLEADPFETDPIIGCRYFIATEWWIDSPSLVRASVASIAHFQSVLRTVSDMHAATRAHAGDVGYR
jgi:hypothetical protein